MVQNPTPDLSPRRYSQLGAIPFSEAPSPAYILHLDSLEENCRLLADVARRSGARILLAQKGFACHAVYPLIRRYLSGTTSSGLHEAYLAQECFGGEVHLYSPAFKEQELRQLARFAHTLVFNSPGQIAASLPILGGRGSPELGLRINPEYSEVATPLYDPCTPGSRLGTTRAALDAVLPQLPREVPAAIRGLHFHTLCEQDADALDRTVEAFERKFADWLPGLSWVNFGGGHHITRPGYAVDRLIRVIRDFRERHGLEVYLEPGEAVALQTGILVTTVIDRFNTSDRPVALLDTSATCHMPDVLEMPYRPEVLGAGSGPAYPHSYTLGGMSCLAGDIIGQYAFRKPLNNGDRLVFLDMAHYTMVKNTTFNGVPLPAICSFSENGGLDTIRRFGYADYRDRLS